MIRGYDCVVHACRVVEDLQDLGTRQGVKGHRSVIVAINNPRVLASESQISSLPKRKANT